MNAARMLAELRRDGLFENEIADMLGVSELTLRNWRLGTTPQAAKLERLIGLHKARGLPERSRK